MSQSNLPIPSTVDYRRLFTEKDLVGFFQVTRHVLKSLSEVLSSEKLHEEVVFISLGRSPAVITEFIRQAYNLRVVDLPLGGMSGGVTQKTLTKPVKLYFEQVLSPKEVRASKVLVVVDFAYGGESIRTARDLLQKYAEDCCPTEKPPHVLMVPISWKRNLLDDKQSLLQGFDIETRAAHRLLKILFLEVDKETYSRHRSIKYDQVLSSKALIRVSDFEQTTERKALERAMQIALNYVKKKEIDLGSSLYLQQRKKKKNGFSYSSFAPGYQPLAEESWRYGIIQKSAAFYSTSVDKSVTLGHNLTWVKLKTRDAWWKSSMRTRRIIALALLLLFVWIVYRMLSWALRLAR